VIKKGTVGGEMDKICIVKLRKRDPVIPVLGCGEDQWAVRRQRDHGVCAPSTDPPDERLVQHASSDTECREDKRVSLTLTPEQGCMLQQNPYLHSFFDGSRVCGSTRTDRQDGMVVLQLVFEPPFALRLLKMGEVLQMLRVGKKTVVKLIREGQLKCYRVGRLNRIRLDDVLSYLENSRLPFDTTNAAETKSLTGVESLSDGGGVSHVLPILGPEKTAL
jgi:excisionase family DNA binding protein